MMGYDPSLSEGSNFVNALVRCEQFYGLYLSMPAFHAAMSVFSVKVALVRHGLVDPDTMLDLQADLDVLRDIPGMIHYWWLS